MCKVHQLLTFLCFLFIITNFVDGYPCISNTPCECFLTEYSFTLINCSHSLPDLPILNYNTLINIIKVVAQNALIHWPLHLCKYSNIQILDLSNSYLDSKYIDLSCLTKIVHLNLSHSRLKDIPNFLKYSLNHLQIIDLSNNQIEIVDGNLFRTLTNLTTLILKNNPLKKIIYFQQLLCLSHIEFINLISSSSHATIDKPITTSQWIYLAHRWNNSNKSFEIRINVLPLQSILPNSDQFQLISLDLMKIILKTLLNSTFTTLFSTPKCNCTHLQNYQRVLSFTHYHQNLSSLFQTSTCLMPNGIIHARLFDQQTFADLHCSLVGKKMYYPTIQNSCSLLNSYLYIYILYFIY